MIISAVKDQSGGGWALRDAVASCCSYFTSPVLSGVRVQRRERKREKRRRYSSYYVTDEEGREGFPSIFKHLLQADPEPSPKLNALRELRSWCGASVDAMNFTWHLQIPRRMHELYERLYMFSKLKHAYNLDFPSPRAPFFPNCEKT